MSQLRTPVKNPPKAPAYRIHRSGALNEDAHTEKTAVPVPKGFMNRVNTPQKVVFGGGGKH
jgi:hypothetical protein